MIRFSNEGNAVSVEEMTEVYFNDHRIKRILKSMLTTNSGIALPSLILLIPILASFMDPSRDFILFLCLGLFPSICVGQTSALIAKSAKHNKSVRLLKTTAVLAVCYVILASLGLISIGALLVFCSKACERPTCVSDAICSGILCLITVIGIVYNIIYAKILILAIWFNEVLQERANTLNMEPVILDDGPISTISEATDGRESPLTTAQLGFSYLRMEHPTEVFP